MSLSAVHRGEIFYVDLDPVVGSETGKNSPVLIIQNDIGNAYSPTTIVAVVTKYSDRKARYPICVSITKDVGLEKDSIVNLAQIRTIDKKRLRGSCVATLSDEQMEKVNQAIKNSLAL